MGGQGEVGPCELSTIVGLEGGAAGGKAGERIILDAFWEGNLDRHMRGEEESGELLMLLSCVVGGSTTHTVRVALVTLWFICFLVLCFFSCKWRGGEFERECEGRRVC